MSEKFRDIYRIETARLKNWNYSWNGRYFITICTKNRENFFGKITDGTIELSETGKIVNKFWMEIPAHFQYTKPDSFVIMPNHIHGIIVINENDANNRRDAIHGVSQMNNGLSRMNNDVLKTDNNVINHNERDVINYMKQDVIDHENLYGINIEERDAIDYEKRDAIDYEKRDAIDYEKRDAINRVSTGGITGNKNPMLNNNLSRIIRWFKGRVTFESRKIEPRFAWQSRFYDHIIRDDKSYYLIQQYIDNNVINWQDDQLYKM